MKLDQHLENSLVCLSSMCQSMSGVMLVQDKFGLDLIIYGILSCCDCCRLLPLLSGSIPILKFIFLARLPIGIVASAFFDFFVDSLFLLIEVT